MSPVSLHTVFRGSRFQIGQLNKVFFSYFFFMGLFELPGDLKLSDKLWPLRVSVSLDSQVSDAPKTPVFFLLIALFSMVGIIKKKYQNYNEFDIW